MDMRRIEGLRRAGQAATTLAIGAMVISLAACGSAPAASQNESSPLAPAVVTPTQAPQATGSGIAMPGAPSSGVVLDLVAEQPPGQDYAWAVATLEAPAGMTFDVALDNRDATARHDFGVLPPGATLSKLIFKSAAVAGTMSMVIRVPGLPAGTYEFICTLHSSEMRGMLTVK